MAIFALIIGTILIVTAVRNSQGALFAALELDVPKFVIWFAAIVAVGAVGFIPGLKGPSRLLLGLILTVIIINNYQKIIKGFTDVWQNSAAEATPAKAATPSGGSATGQASGAAAPVTIPGVSIPGTLSAVESLFGDLSSFGG